MKGEQTSNCAELTAIKHALDHVQDKGKSHVIYTDSNYSLGAINGPREVGGQKIGAPHSLGKNQGLVTNIQTSMNDPHLKGYDVEVSKVEGHSNVHGNVQADNLAHKSVGDG